MLTVLIAAKAYAQHCLRQIVAYVQAELAPDFFINTVRVADMDIGTAHERFNRQHALAFKRCLRFAENNTNGFFRVEANAVALVTRRNLDQCRQNLLAVDNAGNNFLTVHAVHQAHNSGIRANCLADACQCAGQSAVFQSDNQQIYALGFLRAPHLRMVGNVVDAAALVTQTRSTAAFGDNAESDIGELAQSPDYIRAYGSCSQKCDRFYLHAYHSLLLANKRTRPKRNLLRAGCNAHRSKANYTLYIIAYRGA